MVGLLAHHDAPVDVGDFRHVNIAAGIDRDAVRRDELAEAFADGLGAEVGQHVPLVRHHRHARPEVGHVLGQRRRGFRAELADWQTYSQKFWKVSPTVPAAKPVLPETDKTKAEAGQVINENVTASR